MQKLLLGLVAALWAASTAQAAERPNILFVFSDDHAYQAVGAYGSQINQTPNIDRIAKEGVRFDRCYVTNSICGPSRACVLTGKYSHKNGFYDNTSRFDGSQQTFPKLLQGAGYQTAIIGKWHLVTDPTGFDFWQVLPDQGRYYRPRFLTAEGPIAVPGYVTEVITDRALQWLTEDRNPQRPFVLMVQHKAPHREWQPGPRELGRAPTETYPEPETLFDNYADRAAAAREATMRIADDMRLDQDLKAIPDTPFYNELKALMSPEELQAWNDFYDPIQQAFAAAPLEGRPLTRWKYQRYLQDYLRCIDGVDASVGRLLDYLDEAGLAENTVVVYASDQGFYLGEHGWFDKRFMYEQSLRTPLVVRWPGEAKAGSVVDRIVSNLDFAETFLEMAGVEAPADMQGRSFAPLLRGETPQDWRTTFYYHYYEGPPAVHTVARHYGVTDGRYKLIHYYDQNQWELFDLVDDPQELHSVYGQPSYAAVRSRLEEELGRLRAELDVPAEAAEPGGAPTK